MNTVQFLNVIQGSISISVNGKRHTVPIGKDSKFAHELMRAAKNNKSPAMALEFLARLTMTHLNPHHCTLLSDPERAEWDEFFGKGDADQASRA